MERYKRKFKERSMSGQELEIFVSDFIWFKEEDDFKQGALPGTGTDWHEKIGKKFKSFPDLVKYMNRNYGITSKLDNWGAFSGDVGRIEVQMMVDENNVEANKKDLALWKRGQKKLWIANISIYIEFTKSYEPSSDEISKTFGIQEI